MPQQSIIWTVLPNGLSDDGKSVRFSVLVSPRLDVQQAPKTLKSFADFADWPATLAKTSFTLRVDSTDVVMDASNIDASIGTPDSKVWKALFPESTNILPIKIRDRSNDTVVSYDTVQLHSVLSTIYGQLTETAGSGLPSLETLLSNAGIKAVVDSIEAIDDDTFDKNRGVQKFPEMFTDIKNGNHKKYGPLGAKLAEFQLFHTPANEIVTKTVTPEEDPRTRVKWQHAKPTELTEAQAVASIDFHQIVAAMNQYPTLLRKLGLVLDFVVPTTKVPKRASLGLSVTAKMPTVTAPKNVALAVQRRFASPSTQTRHADGAFAAISRPSSPQEDLLLGDGLLKLSSERFALLQTDVDGGMHKLVNFARTLSRMRRDRLADPTSGLPREAGTPALRNAGLMLVHQKRGTALENAFSRNKTLDKNMHDVFAQPSLAQAKLYAEDLVRGWRVDILDKTSGKWRSLCQRVARYDINKGEVVLADLREEGIVRLAATSSTDGSNSDVMYLHESLTVWGGWSLVAQPPGKAIAVDDKQLRDGPGDLPAGIRLRTAFIPMPGSLPKLRYGREYSMRARAVDLAGNSLRPKTSSYAGDDSGAGAGTPYFRYEPVQPPTLALVGTKTSALLPGAGESMARAVVRSFNTQFDDATPSSQEAQRWGAAARVPQSEAELHGVLDGAEWGSPQQYALLAERDYELAKFEHISNPQPPQIGTIPSSPNVTPVQPGRGQGAQRVEKAAGLSYAVLPAGSEALPYLPDPISTSLIARLHNHPLLSVHSPIPIPLYRLGKKWPDVSPFLIRVYESTTEIPRFDEASHTLLVPTPKGTRATLHISAMLDDASLEKMGVWNWVKPAARTALLRRRATGGQLWPLTPARELDIVHAVQRPLLKPDILDIEAYRAAGSTSVAPTIIAACHRNSTVKVDLHASWHEPFDPTNGQPRDLPKDAVPFSIKITDPQGHKGVIEHTLLKTEPLNTIVIGDKKKDPDVTDRIIDPRIHDFGDTRYRRVEYHLSGTTRFREFMPQSVLTTTKGSITTATDANIKLDGASKVVWVPSSSPPPAPEVLYVVPTFGWTRGVDKDGKTTSWRKGGGLRVWLDRPWNATGYGEMLAVVIPRKNSTLDPNGDTYKHTVTQWGNDPVWKSPYVQGVAPSAAHFPLSRTERDASGAWLPPGAYPSEADQPTGKFATENITHPRIAPHDFNGRVDVVPHDVFWDEERSLWYCDIEISHGLSYFPFIRLALARYQPVSVSDNFLSNIVLADFCSLAPNRWLTVANTNATRRSIKVYGPRPDQSSGYAEALSFTTQTRDGDKITRYPSVDIAKSTVVEVWLEKLNPARGDDFGWEKIADGVESLWENAQPGSGGIATPVARAGTAEKPTLKLPVKPVTKATTKPAAGSSATIKAKNTFTTAQKTRAEKLMAERDYDAVLHEGLIETTVEWPELWSGSVTLPSVGSAGARFRIVVAEYEEYLADDDEPYKSPPRAKGRRLVFLEHVELT
jgi:hypothetical protein